MKTIKKALLVTFDFSQRGKSGTGLAAGSLIAACQSHNYYKKKFTIAHLPILMSEEVVKQLKPIEIVNLINAKVPLEELDRLALACYVWSSRLIEPLIKLCRLKGFKGKVILGGYQIHEKSCKELYPSGDYYIPSYAEAALPVAILDEQYITRKFFDLKTNIAELPSPYLTNVIPLKLHQEMIHWETRRGCVFKCNFCAHRDIKNKSVHLFGMDKIKQELDLFKRMKIKKINVLDPIFNNEPNHIDILNYAIEIGLSSLLSLQVRFENISEEFLSLCSKLNIHLEFGLQTTNKDESRIIKRSNSIRKVDEAIRLLQKWQQSFEVSLIYGLPGQTVATFEESIKFLSERNITNIKAFPLMLLEGTELQADKDKYNIIEDLIDDSGIPHVVSSNSFNRNEWQIMHNRANSLFDSEEVA